MDTLRGRKLLLLAALIPPMVMGVLLWTYSINLPIWDEWDTPGMILVWDAIDQASWQHWISQHNESRILFPRLLFVALAKTTDWNINYEILVTFLLAVTITLNIAFLGSRTLPAGQATARALYLFLGSLLIFSPLQSENWLMGLQTIAFIPIACITFALVINQSSAALALKLLANITLATVATFSFANGILCWVVMLPSFLASALLQHKTQKVHWLLAIWGLCLGINLYVYFSDFFSPPNHPSIIDALLNPVSIGKYFFAFIGAPLGVKNLYASQLVGLVVIFSYIYLHVQVLLRARNQQLLLNMLPWLTIAYYTLASGALAAVGRSGFGIELALSSRYVTFSTYGIVALIYLLGQSYHFLQDSPQHATRQKQTAKFVCAAMIFGMLAIYPFNFLAGVAEFEQTKADRPYAKACLLLINQIDVSDCATTKLYPDLAHLTKRANELNSLGYLSPALLNTNNPDLLAVEPLYASPVGFFDQLVIGGNGTYTATGWAVLPASNRPAHAVLLAYQTEQTAPQVFAVAPTGLPRNDVQIAFSKSGYYKSGWQLEFSNSDIPENALISAWSFNSDIGRAYKLHGVKPLPNP